MKTLSQQTVNTVDGFGLGVRTDLENVVIVDRSVVIHG
jgi:hypothetical protein